MTLIVSHKDCYMKIGLQRKEFLEYSNAIDYRDIQKKQNQYILYCSDFRLQDQIDIKPAEGSEYIRSLTEPFNTEM